MTSTPQDKPSAEGDGQGWNPPGSNGGDQYPCRQQGQAGPPDQQNDGGPYSYQAAQASGYAYPTSGGGVSPAMKGAAPKEVMRAYYLILAAGVAYLLSAIISTLTNEIAGGAGASLGVGIGLVFAVVAAAIYVVLAIFIRKGQNWARITATVLAALNVLSILSSLLLLDLASQAAEANGLSMPQTSGLSIALGVIVMLLGVAGVVMTYLKPARPYFAPQKLGY